MFHGRVLRAVVCRVPCAVVAVCLPSTITLRVGGVSRPAMKCSHDDRQAEAARGIWTRINPREPRVAQGAKPHRRGSRAKTLLPLWIRLRPHALACLRHLLDLREEALRPGKSVPPTPALGKGRRRPQAPAALERDGVAGQIKGGLARGVAYVYVICDCFLPSRSSWMVRGELRREALARFPEPKKPSA
jgi:hypothetical protein